jgi:hypothetical protein
LGALKLLGDAVGVTVAAVGQAPQVTDPRPPDGEERAGVDREGEDLPRIQLQQRARRIDARYDRHVARLVSPLGQVHGERRLGGPGDPGQDHVGLVDGVEIGAVVVAHGELDGVDAPEVLVGEAVEQARPKLGRQLEMAGEGGDELAQQVHRGDALLQGQIADHLGQGLVHQGEHHEGPGLGCAIHDASHLGLVADVAEGSHAEALAELGRRGAHRRRDRLARSIRDQVELVLGRRSHGRKLGAGEGARQRR